MAKSILFVAAHRPDRSPSQRFRFEQYFDFLKENGFNIEFSYIISAKDDQYLYRPGHLLHKLWIFLKSTAKRYRDTRRARKFDIVFVQREAFMTGTIFFEKQFKQSGAKLIFDFDDSIWIFDKNSNQGLLNKLKDPGKTSKIIAISDCIVAGNRHLHDYAKSFNDNVTIIPTTIDTEIYKRTSNTKADHKVCIGWSGSFSTVKHFTTVIPALLEIKNKFKDQVHFLLIGDGNYENVGLGVESLDWKKNSEISDLTRIDIGIMPLPDDEWSKGKCGLKGLQYMALEIPTIMSPVGVNSEIIENGVNGFLASSKDEWVAVLEKLINSEATRKSIGREGRRTVVEQFSVESQKDSYLNLFNNILNT